MTAAAEEIPPISEGEDGHKTEDPKPEEVAEPEETEEQRAAREKERKENHEIDCGKILERGIGHLRDSEFGRPPRAAFSSDTDRRPPARRRLPTVVAHKRRKRRRELRLQEHTSLLRQVRKIRASLLSLTNAGGVADPS